jgi:tryptophan-rich sensory protein
MLAGAIMKTTATYAFFIVLLLGGGSAIGLLTGPDEWFAQLSKPSFNPPSWVFAPAWTFLYVLIAVAGCRTWIRDRSSLAMKLWGSQLILNFLWSPVFFGAHRIGAALAVIIILLATIIAYVLRVWSQDKIAALLFFPYLAWVSFATILNAGFLWNNAQNIANF